MVDFDQRGRKLLRQSTHILSGLLADAMDETKEEETAQVGIQITVRGDATLELTLTARLLPLEEGA